LFRKVITVYSLKYTKTLKHTLREKRNISMLKSVVPIFTILINSKLVAEGTVMKKAAMLTWFSV
jgi:hypothetical protein